MRLPTDKLLILYQILGKSKGKFATKRHKKLATDGHRLTLFLDADFAGYADRFLVSLGVLWQILLAKQALSQNFAFFHNDFVITASR
jgi:hypothetical protein